MIDVAGTPKTAEELAKLNFPQPPLKAVHWKCPTCKRDNWPENEGPDSCHWCNTEVNVKAGK